MPFDDDSFIHHSSEWICFGIFFVILLFIHISSFSFSFSFTIILNLIITRFHCASPTTSCTRQRRRPLAVVFFSCSFSNFVETPSAAVFSFVSPNTVAMLRSAASIATRRTLLNSSKRYVNKT